MRYRRRRFPSWIRRTVLFLVCAVSLCALAGGIFTLAEKIVVLETGAAPSSTAPFSPPPVSFAPSSTASFSSPPVSFAPSSGSSSALPKEVSDVPDFSLPPRSAPQSAPPSSAGKPAKNPGWFDDAVLIGDSRTEGLELFDGLGNATYLAGKGLTVETVYTSPIIKLDRQRMTVMQALKQKKFGKVYVMLGINELGWSSFSTFLSDYGKIIGDLKHYQKGAPIYLQSILPVSAKKSASGGIYTNEKIRHANDAIRKLAQQNQVCYLAVDTAVRDVSGALPEEASTDGVHLNAEYCKKWCDYLKAHTEVPNRK